MFDLLIDVLGWFTLVVIVAAIVAVTIIAAVGYSYRVASTVENWIEDNYLGRQEVDRHYDGHRSMKMGVRAYRHCRADGYWWAIALDVATDYKVWFDENNVERRLVDLLWPALIIPAGIGQAFSEELNH